LLEVLGDLAEVGTGENRSGVGSVDRVDRVD
jgi:hypothetical protein